MLLVCGSILRLENFAVRAEVLSWWLRFSLSWDMFFFPLR